MHSGVKAQRENTAVVKDKVHHKSDHYANYDQACLCAFTQSGCVSSTLR